MVVLGTERERQERENGLDKELTFNLSCPSYLSCLYAQIQFFMFVSVLFMCVCTMYMSLYLELYYFGIYSLLVNSLRMCKRGSSLCVCYRSNCLSIGFYCISVVQTDTYKVSGSC